MNKRGGGVKSGVCHIKKKKFFPKAVSFTQTQFSTHQNLGMRMASRWPSTWQRLSTLRRPVRSAVLDTCQIGRVRLGHGTCIPPSLGGSDTCLELLTHAECPVETCLSRNVVCHTVPSYREHLYWPQINHEVLFWRLLRMTSLQGRLPGHFAILQYLT